MPKKLILPLYLLFLLLGGFYVNSVLEDSSVNVTDKEEEKEIRQSHETRVELTINYPFEKTSFIVMRSTDSLSRMLEESRKQDDLKYELTEHTFGTVIDHVNYVYSNDQRVWRLYNGDKDVTSIIRTGEVGSDPKYTLSYESLVP